MSHQLPYTAKASKDFWVWPILGLGLTVVLIGANAQNWTQLSRAFNEVWMGIATLWLVVGVITGFASSHRIVLTCDRIVFHEVLSKAEVLYSQIGQVEIRKNLGSGAPHIEFVKITSVTPVRFSLALCSSKDCAVILNIVAQCAPQAKLGPNATRLRDGKLPFIF